MAGGYGFPEPVPPPLGPSTTEVYDPDADAWAVLGARIGCGGKPGIAGADVGGQFYAFGAYEGPCDVLLPSAEVLDESADRWLPRAEMPTPRVDLAATVADGEAYAIGGRRPYAPPDAANVSAANEAYDGTTDTWRTRSPMPTPRYGLAAATVGGRVYAIGGSAGNIVEVYDPLTDAWTTLAPIPETLGVLASPATAVYAGLIFLVDARCELFLGKCTSFTVVYDPSTGDAFPGPRTNLPRTGAGLERVGDMLVAVAGGGGQVLVGERLGPTMETEVLGLTNSTLSFSWDANDLVDSDRDGNLTNDIDGTGATLTWAYGDDGAYNATLTVTDGGGVSSRDTAMVTILNVAPRMTGVSVSLRGGVADLGLRVAGRKWNVVNLTLSRDGTPTKSVEVRRENGGPDERIAWIGGPFDPSGNCTATVAYEPADLDGKEVGANPVWLVTRDIAGNVTVLAHHTFDVQQSEDRSSSHWNHIDPWVVDLRERLGPGLVAVSVSADDLGSDDLTFVWSTGAVHTSFNDGIGPDPRPSPWGAFPFAARDAIEILYVPGTLSVQVSDDDGGSLSIDIILP